jgi:hypothetical protein
MLMSRYENAGQDRDINTANRFIGNCEMWQYSDIQERE